MPSLEVVSTDGMPSMTTLNTDDFRRSCNSPQAAHLQCRMKFRMKKVRYKHLVHVAALHGHGN